MPAVQSAAASEAPSHALPQARWFTPGNLGAYRRPRPQNSAPGHSRRPSSSHTPGSSRTRAGVWLQEVPGYLRAGALSASLHPARRFPAWPPADPRSPSHARGTRSARRKRDRAQQGHIRPPQKATHPHTHPGDARLPGWRVPAGRRPGPPPACRRAAAARRRPLPRRRWPWPRCGRPPPG